jgi:hypothetical protein
VRQIVGVAIATYLGRSIPSDYAPERANTGPLVWRGQVQGVYVLQGTIRKAPEDTIEVVCEHEAPRRGEVDILVEVDIAGELPPDAPDTLKSIAFSFLSLLNLRLNDYLAPCAPVQITEKLDSGRQFGNQLCVRVERRSQLTADQIERVAGEFFGLLRASATSAKVQTALELYGAQLTEPSAKTRFLLFVMALEALTVPTPRHATALALLEKWRLEVKAEKQKYADTEEEHVAFDALERELLFRRDDSIRSRVRQLLVRVAASDPIRWKDLPQRGLACGGSQF